MSVRVPPAAQQSTTRSAPAREHRTASGNEFSAQFVESFDPKSRGINLAAPDPGAVYKMYSIKVCYEDKTGKYDGADSLWVNATGNERIRNFGKGKKPDTNAAFGTGSTLTRTGPHTFEGTVTFPLELKPGQSREDVRSMGFTFAKLGPDSNLPFTGAVFDGKPFQQYPVGIKLKGPTHA